MSPFLVTNAATSQTLLVWPVPLFQASLGPWYIFCSQINQLLPLSTLRKRGLILPSGHKPRLGFDRKKVSCWIVFNRTIKISTDMFWLDHDCFAAYNFTNYFRRWSRVVTQRSSSSAGPRAHVLECLTHAGDPGSSPQPRVIVQIPYKQVNCISIVSFSFSSSLLTIEAKLETAPIAM